MHNDIQRYLLADYLHRTQIIGRDRDNQYAIFVLVSGLYFG